MNYKIHAILLTVTLFVAGNVEARFNLEECKQKSQEVNKLLPSSINSITTLEGTFCQPAKNGYAFVYQAVVDTKRGDFKPQAKSLMINNLCSNPETLKALKVVDMAYIYKSTEGKYLGGFTVVIDDCKK